MNLSSVILKNLVEINMGKVSNADYGELCLKSKQNVVLPLGSYCRFMK
jgi:hypothetical protein